MTKVARLSLLLTAVLATGVAAVMNRPTPEAPELNPELVSIALANPDGSRPALVTITSTDDPELFLTADYADIYALDRATGRLRRFAIVGASRPNVPTGLAYDQTSKRLFIANYTSNNVLIGRLDLERSTVTIEQEFGQDVAISPENVSIEGRTGDVAVANYDGNDVQIWSRQASSWTRKCSIGIPLAHGVAFAGNHLYATSLGRREILKIDPARCQVLERAGRVGWGKGEFLWPTHVADWDGEHMAVSDAHTGRISIVRKTDLRLTGVFGGNGPSLFNMPYAFIRTGSDGGALVLSTFGGEVVRASLLGAKGKRARDGPLPDRALHERTWDGYRRLDKSASFLHRCVSESYASLLACDGRLSFRMPGTREEHLSGGSHFYFVEIAERATGWVLSSPQHPNLLFIRKSDLRTAVLAIDTDGWQIGTEIIGRRGPIGMDTIEAASAAFLDQADQILGPGARSLEEMARFLARRSTRATAEINATLLVPQTLIEDPTRSAGLAERMRTALIDVGLSGFVEANEICAAQSEACDAARACEVARMASSLGDGLKAVSLGALLTAAMLNPCIGHSTGLAHEVGAR